MSQGKKKKATQQLLEGGGLEGRKVTCLKEVLALLWYKETCHLKNFDFWSGFAYVYEYF